RRDLSTSELDRRLERAGVQHADRLRVVEGLVRAGYVDDGRFGEARAALLAERGLGDEAIRFDLVQRGLGSDEVARALGGLEAESERADRLLARLGGGPRAARALARRGFDPEVIERVASDGGPKLG